MPERPDDFEEAWARIVEELTSDETSAAATAGPVPSASTDPFEADGRGPDNEPGSAPPDSADPTGQARGTLPGSAEGAGTAGLSALFEPLRRAQPAPDRSEPGTDPGAFVDNWQDEGHFTPPPPPELPEGTPVKRLAWAGLLGGPAALALIALTGWDAPRVVGIGAGLVTLAGFVTLVWHLPEAREDGWDDGARL